MPITQAEATTTLKQWQDAYDAGDVAFFDFFNDDATFFTISSVTRIDSLEEFRRGFEPFLTQAGTNRRSQILSPEFQILGDVAIVTFHNRILIGSRVTNMRVTLTMVKGGGGDIKIAHFHSSPLETPQVIPGPGATPETIDLLEERVAGAAAAVGTPK